MHDWHRCDRWERQGLPCPFDKEEEGEEEDDDEDAVDSERRVPKAVPVPARRARSVRRTPRQETVRRLREWSREMLKEPAVREVRPPVEAGGRDWPRLIVSILAGLGGAAGLAGGEAVLSGRFGRLVRGAPAGGGFVFNASAQLKKLMARPKLDELLDSARGGVLPFFGPSGTP